MSKYNFNFKFNIGVSDLSVKIESNSSKISLQAPSGSGKSTFLKCILGIIHKKKIEGKLLMKAKRFGHVPQDSLLIPHLTIEDNLLLSPRANKNLLKEVCDELEITHLLKRYPRMLSGGEKQRAAIARALLCDPETLILDEPFSALDKVTKARVIQFLNQWIDRYNLDLILVTHDEASSALLCEEFWSINNGELTTER